MTQYYRGKPIQHIFFKLDGVERLMYHYMTDENVLNMVFNRPEVPGNLLASSINEMKRKIDEQLDRVVMIEWPVGLSVDPDSAGVS